MEIVKKVIQDYLNVDISNPKRQRGVVEARAMYYKICREHLGLKFREIAESVNKHHASVIHGIKLLNDLIDTDKKIKQDFDIVLNKFEFYKVKRKKMTNMQLMKLCNKLTKRVKKLETENKDFKLTLEWLTDLQ